MIASREMNMKKITRNTKEIEIKVLAITQDDFNCVKKKLNTIDLTKSNANTVRETCR